MFRVFTCGVLFAHLLMPLSFGEGLLLGFLWPGGGGQGEVGALGFLRPGGLQSRSTSPLPLDPVTEGQNDQPHLQVGKLRSSTFS